MADSFRVIRDAWLSHNERCQGDVVIEILDNGSWWLYCIGVETSAVMECGWREEFPINSAPHTPDA